MAHNINLQRKGSIVRVTITDSAGAQVIVDWTRSEVTEVVRGLCSQAGLPEPWKKG